MSDNNIFNNFNFEWDSLLPLNILKKWELWLKELALLLEIRIPRYLFSDILPSTYIELRGFCDSLTQSYAAVCYFRVFDSSSESYKCRIVAAKSKPVTVKQLAIPRLNFQDVYYYQSLFPVYFQH